MGVWGQGGGTGFAGYDYVQTAEPTNPTEGETWYDVDDDAAFVYDGNGWLEMTIATHSQLSGITPDDHHGGLLAGYSQPVTVTENVATPGAETILFDGLDRTAEGFKLDVDAENGQDGGSVDLTIIDPDGNRDEIVTAGSFPFDQSFAQRHIAALEVYHDYGGSALGTLTNEYTLETEHGSHPWPGGRQ